MRNRLTARGPLIGAALLLGLGGFAGCSTLGYYLQAFNGQMELTRKARPIPQVLDDKHASADLKVRLEHVQEIRAYASRELSLPDNGSYRSYVDLQRPYVVWNVFATDEFSVVPHQWCFPIAGCVGYRGYFSKKAADAFAQQLRQKGLDVYVGGVPAYSTLGWMDDPVLSTFIRYPQTEIARLIFHELAHQVVYVPGDSTFNESYAVTVELEGVRRWLTAQGMTQELAEFQAGQARKRDFDALVARYRDRLARLYASGADAPSMRAEKARTFEEMRADYRALREQWGGFAGYDWWFEQPLNNAQLASIAIYTQLVPGFRKLLADCGGDMPCFYAAVEVLAKKPEKERLAVLVIGDQ
jgi:predicted aminopeptidase